MELDEKNIEEYTEEELDEAISSITRYCSHEGHYYYSSDEDNLKFSQYFEELPLALQENRDFVLRAVYENGLFLGI